MSELADAILDGNPELAAQLGAKPNPNIIKNPADEIKKMAREQKQQEAFQYVSTVMKIAERIYAGGWATNEEGDMVSPQQAIAYAQDFIKGMNEFAGNYLKPFLDQPDSGLIVKP